MSSDGEVSLKTCSDVGFYPFSFNAPLDSNMPGLNICLTIACAQHLYQCIANILQHCERMLVSANPVITCCVITIHQVTSSLTSRVDTHDLMDGSFALAWGKYIPFANGHVHCWCSHPKIAGLCFWWMLFNNIIFNQNPGKSISIAPRRAYIVHQMLRRSRFGTNLVDPASSHMLVSRIKPCMSQYKL